MGSIFEFKCTFCNYAINISGGLDRGYDFFIETKNCIKCSQTVDVLVAKKLPGEPDDKFVKVVQQCPNCKSKDLISWNNKCPKCNGRMEKGEMLCDFD